MALKTLHLWGISHHAAPIHTREKAAFSEDKIANALKEMLKNRYFSEIVLLSTCNRTECYIVSNQNKEMKGEIESSMKAIKGRLPSEISKLSYYLKGKDAIQHLFKVGAGLDSMILGEAQILGQVKKAYLLAQKEGAVDVYLNKLFTSAIQVAKKIRSETPIGKGSMSIAYAAVELAQKIFANLKEKRGLVIGAGKIGELNR